MFTMRFLNNCKLKLLYDERFGIDTKDARHDQTIVD
jgi:hypothetical protein